MNKKVAVVTGAAGIVGPAICRALREQGWLVAATDRSSEEFDIARRTLGLDNYWDYRWTGNIGSQAACRTLIRETEADLGPVSLLVNNAAFAYREPSLDLLDEQKAIEMLQVNLLAPLWLVTAAEPSLRTTKGVVVNLSSAQTQGWLPENHLYVASKAALEKLTQTLSDTLGKHGARCFGIRLGSFPGTHFFREFLAQLPEDAARQMTKEVLPRHFAGLESSLGANFIGHASELGTIISFLVSDAARMLNGTTLTLDGGMTTRPIAWGGSHDGHKIAKEWFDNWKKLHESGQS